MTKPIKLFLHSENDITVSIFYYKLGRYERRLVAMASLNFSDN